MKANEARGKHSCGYYDGRYLHKTIGLTNNLARSLKALRTRIFIGHTRFKTHGEIVARNQHPFHYGNVTGAHNGVVHNYLEVGEKYNLPETEVDSQMIFQLLNKTQNNKKLGEFSNTLATLFTKEDGQLYAYRKGNPLWVGILKSGDGKIGLYFSSLPLILKECGLTNLFQLKEGRLYIFKDGGLMAKQDIKHNPVETEFADMRTWSDYQTEDLNNTNWYPATHQERQNGWSRSQSQQAKFNF